MSCASVAVSLTMIVVRPPAGSVPRLQVTTPPSERAGAAWAGARADDRERAVAHVCVGDDDTAGVGRAEVVDQDRARCDVAREHRHVGLAELREPSGRRDPRRSSKRSPLLLSGFGSMTLTLPTSAELVMPMGWPAFETALALTCTLITTVEVAPFSTLPKSHVSVPVGPFGADPTIVRHELDLRQGACP